MNEWLILADSNPLVHVVDHAWRTVELPRLGKVTLLSNHIFMMMVAAALLFLIIPIAARRRGAHGDVEGMTPRGLGNAIESVCEFLRDKVARPFIGEHTDRFIIYIWSAFFFILFCNLLGLLPIEPLTKPLSGTIGLEHGIYGTATGNIWVTSALAACTLLMIVINGLAINGMSYVKHFFMGPFPINIFIAVLEVFGLIVKAAALAIRLFANMCAGHILLAVLLSFIAMAGTAGVAMGIGVAIPVVLGSVAIMLLELFVAFLQAFIFTFLSTVFIGMAVNIHHDDHHEHDHAGEAHAH